MARSRRNILSLLTRLGRPAIADPDPEMQETGRWLLAGAPGDLGEWLDNPNAVGKSWKRHDRTEARDQALIEAVDQHYPGLNPTEQARRLSRELQGYKDTIWRSACLDDPASHKDRSSLEDSLWNILNCNDKNIGEQQIARRIRKARRM
jgi:hypothetical protein